MKKQQPPINPGRAALQAGLLGNVLAILNAALVFLEPPGSAIRPMPIFTFLLLIPIFTAFLVLPAAIMAIRRDHQVVIGSIGLLLGLSPLLIGLLAIGTFIKFFGYTLKP